MPEPERAGNVGQLGREPFHHLMRFGTKVRQTALYQYINKSVLFYLKMTAAGPKHTGKGKEALVMWRSATVATKTWSEREKRPKNFEWLKN